MKKFAFVFAALAACFAISCTKEVADDAPQGGMQTVTVTASVEQMTKTAYDAEGKFAWHKGDQISILGSDKIFYTFTATEAGATATFTGVLPEGITLRKEAYSPADAGHHRDGDNWFFNVAEYKDLTATGSADLPMGAYLEPGNYVFRHITGAALFTFTDIPEGIEAVEIAFSHGVQLSGEFQSWTDSDDAGKFWVYGAHNAAEGTTQGSYVRKVSVVENTAKVYLPYPTDGTIWAGLHVSVTGFNAAGEEVVLLEDLATAQNIDKMPRATVTPVEPISLAAEDEGIDWNAEGVAVAVNDETAVDDSKLMELRAYADAENLYIRMKATLELEGANFVDISFCDGMGTNSVWWGWTTTGTATYWKEHKGTLDATGNLISMMYSHNGEYQPIVCETEFADDAITWYFVYPREYVDKYKNSNGEAYVSGFLWKDYGEYWACPARSGEMLKVTLP